MSGLSADASAIERVAALLAAHRFRISSERDLQAAIEIVLRDGAIDARREVALGPAGVIDFLCADGLGLEVKIAGGLSEVTRQLHRYAERDEVRALLLVTTMMRHRRMPETLRGKPVRVVHLLGGAL